MQDHKKIAKKILSNHFGIVFGFFLFTVSLFLIILPELALKTGIHILADKTEIKWLKLLKIFVDIPVALTTQLLITILFVGINYFVFSVVRKVEFRKVCRIKTIGKFFLLILFDTVMLILYNGLNILILLFLKGYKYFSFITEIYLPFVVYGALILGLIVSVLFVNLSFLAHFGSLIYIYFMDLDASLKDVFSTNETLYRNHKKEIRKLLISFAPNLLVCVFIFPIFYLVPYLQITLILVVDKFIQGQKQKADCSIICYDCNHATGNTIP